MSGAAARYAYETYGLTPVFVSIEKHQDPAAGRLAAKELGTIPHYFLDDAGGAGTIIGALSRMEAVVSMRLHALIFAAVRGVPLVGVVYDPKVSAFLDDAGQDLYAQLDQVTPELLRALIDAAAQRRQDRKSLEEKTARLVQLERENSQAAARLLAE